MTQPGQEQTPPPVEQATMVQQVAQLLLVAAGVEATISAVQRVLAPLKLAAEAVAGAVRMALRRPFGRPRGSSGVRGLISVSVSPEGGRVNAAAEFTLDREVYYRAAYLINGAKRINRSMREGRSLRDALKKERPHFQAHLDAGRNRAVQAKKVDAAAARYGPLLGWYAKMDQRTSAECRDANRKNFALVPKPYIGYPGTVHPHCRCVPGKPIPGAALLPTARKRRKAA